MVVLFRESDVGGVLVLRPENRHPKAIQNILHARHEVRPTNDRKTLHVRDSLDSPPPPYSFGCFGNFTPSHPSARNSLSRLFTLICFSPDMNRLIVASPTPDFCASHFCV